MPFESGSLGFRMLYVPQEIPEDIHGKFANYVLGSIDHLRDEEINGWVGPRHLLDREITAENIWPSGYLQLSLCQAQRKIPPSLLRAECRMEELVWMRAEGRHFVNRQTRSQIKKDVIDRLLPQMPPTLKGIDCCYDRSARMMYVTAMSEKQMDAFLVHFTKATDIHLTPVDPKAAAWQEAQCMTDQWPRWSLADDQWADCEPGREFLMWLWFLCEERGGAADVPGLDEFAVMVEGPLLFDQADQGEALVRKGEPLFGAETRAALLSGKKLRQAKVTLARSDKEQWSCTLNADEFVIRGLKMPPLEAGDPAGRFQERMEQLDTFRQAFLGLFGQFAKLREEESSHKQLDADMRKWIAKRPARKLNW